MFIKKIILLILLIFLFSSYSSCVSEPERHVITHESIESHESIEPQTPEILQELDINYKTVNDQDLLMDIYYPTKIIYEKSPLIVMFYGGGWIAGDKTQPAYMFTPIIKELRENGYIIAMPQYRYATYNNYFPAQIDDCADSIIYLQNNADKYNINIDSIGVMGYSAGAQLAMLSAYTLNKFTDIKYCLSFAGPTKFYGEELTDYSQGTLYLVENLFNGTYDEKEQEYMAGSPYYYIINTDTKTPLLLVHDEQDDVVPFSQSQIMYDKAVEVGIDCELLKLRGFRHQINFNYDSENESVKEILDFIYKYS